MKRNLKTAAVVGTISAALTSSATTFAEEADIGLEEIVVTAQKREQNLQDVPISVSALSADMLEANRITSVIDLGSVAPGLTARNTTGGLGAPFLTIRGEVGSGSVPGQDKGVSLNLDGVYIGANYGFSSNILDLERVEVLRGPQGTLFGRNSTGGAVSFVTHDPTGEFGIHQQLTGGNYDQARSVTRIELPASGPFSGYISYMHDEREGDVDNLDRDVEFDRSAARGFGRETSADTLGAVDSDSWRVAVKFEPTDTFNMIYKYDGADAETTANATGLVVFDAALTEALLNNPLSPGLGTAIVAAFNANPVPLAGTRRPDAVRNAFTTVGNVDVEGHNLTLNWQINDQWSLKNILAYRKTSAYASADYTGLGQLFYPGGSDPFYVFVTHQESKHKQWSDEIQLNYSSDLMTLTVGALYYSEEYSTGAPDGLLSGSSLNFVPLPGNVLPPGRDLTFVDAKSLAGFGQAEVHVSEQVDLIGGLRVTRDEKDGDAFVNSVDNPFDYEDTNTTYNVGVNYRPMDHLMVYGTVSTGFISGGSIAGVEFEPEKAESVEVGVKADLFDRRLRVNLALFDVNYDHVQAGVPGYLIGRNDLNLAVADQGDAEAKGTEFEVTVSPFTGLTLNAGYTYTDYEWKTLFSAFGTPETFPVWLRPKHTANASAAYETEPLFNNAVLAFHLDGNWRSKIVTPGFVAPPTPGFEAIYETGDYWVLNGRAALTDIAVFGGSLEIALWGRNLTDADNAYWGSYTGFVGSTTYEPARTYGVDVTFDF